MKHLKPLNRKPFRIYVALVLCALVFCTSVAFAAEGDFSSNDAVKVVTNLSLFVFSVIRAVGLILLGMGILTFGMSLKNHDPSSRASAMLTIAGGIVITFAREILELITGTPIA